MLDECYVWEYHSPTLYFVNGGFPKRFEKDEERRSVLVPIFEQE